MKEIIRVLPDQLANQIAAGEVVQRPSSVVKELLENALDAGATEIQLIVQDAGKQLIQVVDNGTGMNPIDARMSFERHATSKIRNIDDLFAIKTMGFRGEALASIAAVAQVELKTRSAEEELGTLLQIEAGAVKKQEPIASPTGTNLAVRNLFYNVPARRKFLKSDTSEWKHIVNEFMHVALAFPSISFRLFHNSREQFYLKPETLKTRIAALLGTRKEQQLIPIEEDTELLQIAGFVGKPAAATKSRGNQYFFVNGRFIRSAYLNHAVVTAFEGLIEKDAYPLYVLRLSLNSERVDVNVHPNKQEVKFDDERTLYAYLHAAVQHALAQYNITPSLDFTLHPDIQNSDAVRLPFSEERKEQAQKGFLAHSFSGQGRAHRLDTEKDRAAWEQQRKAFLSEMPESPLGSVPAVPGREGSTDWNNAFFKGHHIHSGKERMDTDGMIQWESFLATTVKSGILLMHKTRARERIIYESLQQRLQDKRPSSQQLLFPFEMEVSPADMGILEEALPFLAAIGFQVVVEGQNSLMVSGLPPGLTEGEGRAALADLMREIQYSPLTLKDPLKVKLLEGLSRSLARGDARTTLDSHVLIDELFACKQPQLSPSGKKVFTILPPEKLNSLLR